MEMGLTVRSGACVAIPRRNQRLFHRVFQLDHHIRSAISLNFIKDGVDMCFVN